MTFFLGNVAYCTRYPTVWEIFFRVHNAVNFLKTFRRIATKLSRKLSSLNP